MTVKDIIAALLPIFAQALPQLVADIANLIKGTPQLVGETDEAYINRLHNIASDLHSQIVDEDSEIQK